MRKLILPLLLLSATARAQPPATPKGTGSKLYHGTQVPDPYRWLEKADDPKVKAWIEAQNQYAEASLAKYPAREALAKRIGQLATTPPTRTSPQLAGQTLLFMKDSPPAAQPVLVGQAWPGGAEKVLVDTNGEANPGAITDFWPSPSGKYVAYGTAVGGSELTTIFFVETATGKKLPDVLANAAGGTTPPSLAWDQDETGLTYVRLPKDSLFNASLYHHKLGNGEDKQVFGQGLSPVAEWELTTSEDGSQAAALVHFGDGAPTQVATRTNQGWKLTIGPEADIRGGGRWIGNQLLTVHYKDAPRGEVRLNNKILIPQSQWAVKDVYPIEGGVLVARVWGSEQRLEHWNEKGQLIRVIPLEPGIGLGTIASSAKSPDALITYRGWTIPERWVSYNGASGDLKTIFQLTPVGDYSDIVATRSEAVSRDR